MCVLSRCAALLLFALLCLLSAAAVVFVLFLLLLFSRPRVRGDCEVVAVRCSAVCAAADYSGAAVLFYCRSIRKTVSLVFIPLLCQQLHLLSS